MYKDEFRDENEEYGFTLVETETTPETNQQTEQDIFVESRMLNESPAEEPKKQKKQKSGKRKRGLLKKGSAFIASAAVFGLVAGVCFQAVSGMQETGGKVQLEAINEKDGSTTGGLTLGDTTGNAEVVQTGTDLVTMADLSGVVKNVQPAIVAINCSAVQTQYDFFGRGYQQEISGSGSGIIIGQSDKEIFIATNNHVVDGASSIQIVFADDSAASATVKGTEPSSDLAVVAVRIQDLSEETMKSIKIATLGNSDQVEVGEMVIAIGNALGFGQSSTFGWISALDREVTVDGITLHLLQTDAAINPGNSGGALLNVRGEVIGINSVKYTDTDVEGIGYAIPISDAIPILNDLMNREVLEEGEQGYLGIIKGKEITNNFSSSFSIPVGVYIYQIEAGSPAEQAGLHQGDIITEIKGRTVETMEELRTVLTYTKAGTTVELTVMVLEQGSYVEKTVSVTLGNRPVK